MAPPTEKLVAHTPMATVRWRASRNMFRISDSVEGASVAPATPSRARAAINMEALRENAASTDAAPKVAAPSISKRRRPMRSPSVPMVMSRPATRKP
jgi:hypothetical protein